MNSWKNLSVLEVVEKLAEWEGLISSEEELSERFDEEILPSVLAQYSPDDSVAINQSFNDWVDGLVREGTIHSVQGDQYTYVGEKS